MWAFIVDACWFCSASASSNKARCIRPFWSSAAVDVNVSRAVHGMSLFGYVQSITIGNRSLFCPPVFVCLYVGGCQNTELCQLVACTAHANISTMLCGFFHTFMKNIGTHQFAIVFTLIWSEFFGMTFVLFFGGVPLIVVRFMLSGACARY